MKKIMAVLGLVFACNVSLYSQEVEKVVNQEPMRVCGVIDSDGDGIGDDCDVCDGRNDLLFSENGSCPDVAFRLAILPEPSPNDETDTPPQSCNTRIDGATVVEVWATKYSPDGNPDDAIDSPGIACAFIDLVMDHEPLDAFITYGFRFDVFTNSGRLEGNKITNLGGCNLFTSSDEGWVGVGVWPQWVLVARIDLVGNFDQSTYHLEPPSHQALMSSIVGIGAAKVVDFGSSCSNSSIPVNKSKKSRNNR